MRLQITGVGGRALIQRSAQHSRSQPGFLDVDPELDDPGQHDFRHDTEREKSRVFLNKCAQEIAYHVLPTSHPPPDLNEQDMPNMYGNQQMPQQSFEEAYLQQQRQKQQQQQNNMMAQNHQSTGPNYPENAGMARTHNQANPPSASREMMDRRGSDPQQSLLSSIDNRKQTFDHPADERADSMKHAFDGYGRQISTKEDTRHEKTADDAAEDSDGWNFDDPPAPKSHAEVVPPHRPDTDAFPNANFLASKSPPRGGSGSHKRKGSGSKKKGDAGADANAKEAGGAASQKKDSNFRVRFALRGHLDVVRAVIFTGGGSPSEPEICTCSDDGTIKRWIIPASYGSHSSTSGSDLDVSAYFTHRGHVGAVTSLAACPPAQNFSSGGRALGDGWVFSGGQDASVRVWERGRVDPKATLDGHTDAVWGLCVLPGTAGSVFGDRSSHYGGPDRILLASGAADGRILIWAVSAPPQLSSPQSGSRRAGGSRRANSISSGSNFPSSPQPSTATNTPFHYTLVHHIIRSDSPAPTCISPLSLAGINFVVSYTDASILVYDTRTGEEIVGMASLETYDGTPSTGVNSVVATTVGFDGTANLDPNNRTRAEEEVVHGATGSSGGVEGVIISGYEDRYIRFFDANSGEYYSSPIACDTATLTLQSPGQCTYTMLAHPAAISALSLSPDGRELVSAGHDASLRFWNLEKRSCIQEITSHRLMRGEGVCAVVWSRDGRWVVSGGGDGVVKVFSRS